MAKSPAAIASPQDRGADRPAPAVEEPPATPPKPTRKVQITATKGLSDSS